MVFIILFGIFFLWFMWKLIEEGNSPIMREKAQITGRMKRVKMALDLGQITEEEYYEEYYDYKEKMKDWEIKSGYAEFRKREHPYWKDYYRRHEERKHKK